MAVFDAGFEESEHFDLVDAAAGPERLRVELHGGARLSERLWLFRDGGHEAGFCDHLL